MKGITGTLPAALAGLLMLAACQVAPSATAPAEPAARPGSFAAYLANEYEAYAAALAEEGAESDAAQFIARADEAAAGQPPAPLEGNSPELAESRERLLTLRESSVLPHLVARAQVMHDCTVLRAEALCETARADAIALLEEAEDTGRALHQHRILFAPGSIRLDEAAREIIQRIGLQLLSLGDYRVTVSGHAERSGSEAAENWLAQRRAASVALALQDIGLPAARLRTLALDSSVAPVKGPQADRVDIRIDLMGMKQ